LAFLYGLSLFAVVVAVIPLLWRVSCAANKPHESAERRETVSASVRLAADGVVFVAVVVIAIAITALLKKDTCENRSCDCAQDDNEQKIRQKRQTTKTTTPSSKLDTPP
jgi:short subunit fatty acids transporter